MRNRWRALAAGCTLRSSERARREGATGALWPNPLLHRRHSTNRCAAGGNLTRPLGHGVPYNRHLPSHGTQFDRMYPVMSCHTPRLYPVMTHRMQTHASSQPASLPACQHMLVPWSSLYSRSEWEWSGQVPGSTRDSTHCKRYCTAADSRSLARSLW